MSVTTGTTGPTGTASKTPIANWRRAIFIYDLIVVAVLLLIGVLYFKHNDWFDLGGTDHPSVNLSIHCIWFGALGGIIISLKGVYDHAFGGDPWNDSFNLWHIGRPVSGGIAGLMTFLLMQLVNPATPPSEPVAYAAAFIFGTQERRFFDLLSEVARLIVQVPERTPTAALMISGVTPNQGAAGIQITIAGVGINSKATATLGGASVSPLTVASDGTSATAVAPPKPAGSNVVDLIVTNPDGKSFTLAKAFTYTA
jgi:hypothetical protein